MTPILGYSRSDPRLAQAAQHVDDAQNRPATTYPNTPNKAVPGGLNSSPLHRETASAARDANHAAAVAACRANWGPDYTHGGTLDCDEYPFQSSKEGAARGNGMFSARPIAKERNRYGGTVLGAFFGANRVIENDAYRVTVVP